jgi:Ala-tRNA(Pro) deacylase
VMSFQAGLAAVTEFLEREGVPYEVVEHERTQTAAAEARAAGMPPADVAKTVVLRDQNGLRLAVIPASERLDMHKLREALGSRGLRLVTEREMAEEFDGFEVGAVPPFGSMFNALELVDERLLEHDRILCSGGDHEHAVVVDPRDVVKAADARVADICEG